jgi:predicted phage terminase large subunit-like protein
MDDRLRNLGLSLGATVAAPADILARLDAELEKRRIERERVDIAQNADAIRARCKSFIGFVREAWHILEPRTPFVEGWVTRAICAHLEAITWGKFLALNVPNRVRFNVPPGMTKSLLVSVLWNAWEWGPCDLAHHRFLSTSYNADWVKRDTRKTRDLIMSDWYQQLWGDRVKLVRYGETSFENGLKGSREGVAFESLTGGRGDRLTIDDPLSVVQSKSDADREHAKYIMRERVPMSINDPIRSAIALIMQRVHMDDPSGLWEQIGVPHVALVLPMRFEVARRCTTPIFVDPRELEGELLFPERFPHDVVDRMEREMSSYAVSGQHQQRPVPREGGMFKRHWFKMRSQWPQGYRWCRHWDLADTEDTYGADPPYTAGVLLGKPHDGSPGYCVGSVVRCREEAPAVRKLVKQTAELDQQLIAGLGGTYEIQIPQDPGSSGKTVRRDMISMLDGFDAHWLIESKIGSKIDRAEPFAAQAENGNVELLTAGWNEAYLDEMSNFPGLKFKDQADATSGAYARLQIKRRWEPKLVRSGSLTIYGR